jgi:DNA-binding CsgD family transcriptional regulator
MGTRDVYGRVLVQACLVAGDESALARRLGVPVETLVAWLLGEGKVPNHLFLRAVDVVLERSKDQVERNRALLERVRAERKLSERGFALAFIESQSGILERLARGAPLESVLGVLVLALEALAAGMLGSVLLLGQDGRMRHAAAPSLPRAYLNAIDGLKIGPAVGSCGTAMYTRKTVIVSDIATDPRWSAYREPALQHGLRACWSAPIISPHGKVLGAFAMYYREPRHPRPQERRLVEVGAQLAAIAIGSASEPAPANGAAAGRTKLSTRELEVMRLIAQGEPVKRIATGLRMATSTVYTHRTRIFQKLGIDSNARLIRYAIAHRIVP